MLFNTLEFAIFLPVVFIVYWGIEYVGRALSRCRPINTTRLQNAFIIVASYFFYACWDWRFLFLIAFTSFCSWGSGLLIGQYKHCQGKRAGYARVFMWLNIVVNIGILATFKYYDFFVSEFGRLFGFNTDTLLLKIILPVGISFYTFQALSYSIDVYRGKLSPTRDILAFFAFISFFPQLVAGPIERATNLLPQFLQPRRFEYSKAVDGMRQILWGLFKKIVIADNCAIFVDQVWSSYSTQSGSTLLLAAVLFTFQIYGDFSGYSDIAIGTAKLFGIKLMRNFNNPYFSRDIAEFWRRWHISLTTWFRDYVYIPLGGSRPEISEHIKHPDYYKKMMIVRNTFVIFLLSGLWHGANWTFIVWGAYHALLFLPLILSGKNRKYISQVGVTTGENMAEHLRLLPTVKEFGQMWLTFMLALTGWIIFRSSTISEAWHFLCGMWQWETLNAFYTFFIREDMCITAWLCVLMILVEWLQRDKQHGLDISNLPTIARYAVFIIVVEAIIFFLPATPSNFIYFQF